MFSNMFIASLLKKFIAEDETLSASGNHKSQKTFHEQNGDHQIFSTIQDKVSAQ